MTRIELRAQGVNGILCYGRRAEGERSENCSERCKKFIDDDNFLTDGREIYKRRTGVK